MDMMSMIPAGREAEVRLDSEFNKIILYKSDHKIITLSYSHFLKYQAFWLVTDKNAQVRRQNENETVGQKPHVWRAKAVL